MFSSYSLLIFCKVIRRTREKMTRMTKKTRSMYGTVFVHQDPKYNVFLGLEWIRTVGLYEFPPSYWGWCFVARYDKGGFF